MKIVSADIYDADIFPKASHWHPVILRLTTDEGIYGVGEVALAYGTGSAAGIGMLKQMVERYVIGADATRIEKMWHHLYSHTFWGQGGGPVIYGAMSAIDQALWDIRGKKLGQPVYELLGGKARDKIRVYANGWYSLYTDEGRNVCNAPEEYAEAALKVVADGYNALKFDPFNVHPDGTYGRHTRVLSRERADLAYERVKAVREAVGPDVDILVEVHGNLGVTSAIEMGRCLADLRPFFYEEPVDAMNVDVMLKVSKNVPMPIAAGERLYTRYGFRQYIEKQAVDIVQPDLGLAGGISEVKKIAAMAEIYGLHVQPHNCAGPVCTAASVQLDACITNFIIQEWFPYRDPRHYDLVEEAFDTQAVNGEFTIPDKPGLGVTLNEEVVARYRVAHIT
ncbi:MAG TPA: mandelate racemase/muconate lactonizing enzyme family protein [Chloroflexi bacterium]|nr:mandelate racemase/muconate lactonizing enzyme family protein [Chloroflexota bacterium]